ncbi:uncharacterized protein LOC122534802 isoform X2 [Frieseomelitta varia]|uniref:uncharacterized protein LOC122534802 isoform X2 n=1 Tax=Frieseomelitta varia TaxID=561572 RepID=UPI001CB6ADDF|nr:uncharacterized protein LOC122534802 isoform X2 [Frieseomelitta varia]
MSQSVAVRLNATLRKGPNTFSRLHGANQQQPGLRTWRSTRPRVFTKGTASPPSRSFPPCVPLPRDCHVEQRPEMQITRAFFILGCCFLVMTLANAAPSPEEPAFHLPVQLIGFPVITIAVRLTNFVKKLAYSLNPETYVSRVRRDLPLVHDEEILDVGQVEKKLISELGSNVCVYERICAKYAAETLQKRSGERALDWDVVFR